ncbi:MAG: DNA polymerase IV [Ruminococcaceae bacterium]|nr:DNA polymerase IV [Oscillospiraceae bacterium]
MDRTILHSDCNSFYASVELQRRPELRGLPVSVGGDAENRHGIILASNPLAKKYGIKTGEALWQARQKCRNLVIIPPDYRLYLEFSQATRQIYLEYTDRVEPFGLDEAWLDVTESRALFGDGMAIAGEINRRVKEELGITVSVGVSYNKLFAKLGSDYRKPDAITEINHSNYQQIVYPLPVGDMLFVGRSTAAKLNRMGVFTIGELADMPPEVLRSAFGKVGEMLRIYACGEDHSPVALYGEREQIKSVGNSTTAPRDLECDEDAKIVIFVLADSVSRRLREKGLCGRVVTVSVRDSHMCWYSHQRRVDRQISQFADISELALELFRESYDWKMPVRSIGVSVSALEERVDWLQQSLFFDAEQYLRRERLEQAVGSVKHRYGTGAVCPAVLLKDMRLAGFDPLNTVNVLPTGG